MYLDRMFTTLRHFQLYEVVCRAVISFKPFTKKEKKEGEMSH